MWNDIAGRRRLRRCWRQLGRFALRVLPMEPRGLPGTVFWNWTHKTFVFLQTWDGLFHHCPQPCSAHIVPAPGFSIKRLKYLQLLESVSNRRRVLIQCWASSSGSELPSISLFPSFGFSSTLSSGWLALLSLLLLLLLLLSLLSLSALSIGAFRGPPLHPSI